MFVGDLLGAATAKAAALIAFLPLVVVALLVIGTFGLALAAGGHGIGQVTAVEHNGVFGRSRGKRSRCIRAEGWQDLLAWGQAQP